jgi:hypothetical protein
MITPETAQAAVVAYLKSQTTLVALLANANQIKEMEWQGDDFVYPGVRVSLDFVSGDDICFPDTLTVYIDAFSEEKSSKQAVHLSSVIYTLLRNTASFTQNGIKFFMIHPRLVKRPDRLESGVWKSAIEVDVKASG